MDSHYARLGLQATASTAEVRAAYRELALQLHPDKGGDPEAFQSIQSAFDTLSDTERRQRYDRLLAKGGAAAELAASGVEARFAQDFRSGGFAGGPQPGSADDSARPRREGDGFGGIGLMGQMQRNEIAAAEERKTRGPEAVAERGVQMDHSEGFAAWLRNNAQGIQGSVLTGDDLVSKGLIHTTGVLDLPLPELRGPAVMYDEHGSPADVLSLCAALPCKDRLEHGEVLVRMLAAPVNDEDLLRATTPLHALNALPPFDQVQQQWEPVSLPAVAGVDGVGVVVATARQNDGDKRYPGSAADSPVGEEMVPPLEPKDWVVVKPMARAAPVGSWRGLLICQECRLCAVPPQLMPPAVLACSRALATAYRLLEDYGSLRPGDAIIQNAADEQVGLAVLQLCKLLRLTCISALADTPDFLVRAARLKQDYGAVHVIRDGPAMADAISAAGVPAPRLALDALGGESGRRLFRLLRAGSPLVCYALRSNRLPTLDVSLLLYHQISLHGFSLNQWVEENGSQAYAQLLGSIAELVNADKLKLPTVRLTVGDGAGGASGVGSEELKAALLAATHGADGGGADSDGGAATARKNAAPGSVGGPLRGSATSVYHPRPKICLELGTIEQANATYFALADFQRSGRGSSASPTAMGVATTPKEGGDLEPETAEEQAAATSAASAGPGGAGEAADADATVEALLERLGLSQYAEAFAEEEFSLEILRESAGRPDELRQTLKELGMKKLGHREKLISALM